VAQLVKRGGSTRRSRVRIPASPVLVLVFFSALKKSQRMRSFVILREHESRDESCSPELENMLIIDGLSANQKATFLLA
jgi:hypothetical protein